MNSFDPFNQQSKAKNKTAKATNFIEALKDIGASAKKQAKEAAFKSARSVPDQLFGLPQAPKEETGPANFEKFLESREKQTASRERNRYQQQLERERLVSHHREEEAKLKIKAVQEELQKLAQVTEGLSIEVKKAAFVATVEPGVYHENFFDRIRRCIELARKKIAQSKTWLEVFNHRSKKRSHYWANAKKSGTKYTLSQERTIATQVG